MTTEQVTKKIQTHPKFKDLGFVQAARIPVVAAWASYAISGLKKGINKERILNVVNAHKTHKEFNGILFDIINSL
jgi:hypothetical protein